MNTSVSLPNTIQIRPSRLTGLVVGVAVLASVTTWSVSQVTTDSHSTSNPKSGVASSQSTATKPYIDGVDRARSCAAGGGLRKRLPDPAGRPERQRGQPRVAGSRCLPDALRREPQRTQARGASGAAAGSRPRGDRGLGPGRGADRPLTGVAEAERGAACGRHRGSSARPARCHVRQRGLSEIASPLGWLRGCGRSCERPHPRVPRDDLVRARCWSCWSRGKG